MKTVILFAVIVIAAANPVITKNGRRYVPEEEKVTDKHYMLMESGDGKLHVVNLKLKPKNVIVNTTDVTFYLHTRNNAENGEHLASGTLDDLINSKYFDPSKKNIFTVHGWTSGPGSGENVRVRRALFEMGEDVNAFAVDWSGPAGLFYTFSSWAVPLVGNIIGEYINQMMDHYNLTPSDFVLIGHSLGGNVVGCAGAAVDGLVDHIVGLDPALPMFSLEDRDTRLDETDAQMVHVIHTNGGFKGFLSAIGHVDYYPNGGMKQAGCGPDLIGSCAHGRSVDYYVESILTSGFRSISCTSYDDYQSGDCDGNEETYLGEWPLDTTASGDYYLKTAESSPFALG